MTAWLAASAYARQKDTTPPGDWGTPSEAGWIQWAPPGIVQNGAGVPDAWNPQAGSVDSDSWASDPNTKFSVSSPPGASYVAWAHDGTNFTTQLAVTLTQAHNFPGTWIYGLHYHTAGGPYYFSGPIDATAYVQSGTPERVYHRIWGTRFLGPVDCDTPGYFAYGVSMESGSQHMTVVDSLGLRIRNHTEAPTATPISTVTAGLAGNPGFPGHLCEVVYWPGKKLTRAVLDIETQAVRDRITEA